jgi:subtilase family serine protease
MRTRTVRVATGITVAAGTLLGSMIAVTPSASAATSPKAIPNTKPVWTAHAKHLGAAKSTAAVTARVYFAPKGGIDALKKTVAAISTPGSAQYQHYLTQPQYTKRYGVTSATVTSTTKYLRAAGLKVSKASAGNHYVTVTGTVKAANKAFGTKIERYQHSGQKVQAPSTTLKVPAALSATVLTVSGLDTTAHKMAPATAKAAPAAKPADAPAGFRNSRPCSRYYGQVSAKYQADFKTPLPKYQGKTLPYVLCGYTGPQFRGAYEGDTALDGTGATVGIVDAYAAPTIVYDTTHYASEHGDASYAKGQYTQTVPKTFTDQEECGSTGWYGEQTLDVEAVHAMAGGAKIHYYGAKSCNDSDFTDAIQKVVDQDAVQIVSNSYGEPEEALDTGLIVANEAVYLQGATEGISFLFSSGDNGDELANTGIKQADADASDPYVTAVGGTATGIDGNNKLQFQTGWGTGLAALSTDGKSWGPTAFSAGAGGGTSALFNQPSYQAGVSKSPYRTVPDVAMDADNATGMLIGETQTFSNGTYYDEFRLGGTSLASPLFAGMTALAVGKAGHGGGFLNPTIYAKKAAFADVLPAAAAGVPDKGVVRVNFVNSVDATKGLSYSVRTFDQDSSLATTKGYDLVTGLGVPKPAWFNALGTGS